MPSVRHAFLLSALLLIATPLSGQISLGPPVDFEDDAPPKGPVLFWGGYGVGTPFVSGGDPEGDAELAQIGFERDGKIILLRAARIEEPYGTGSEPVEDYSLMFGLGTQRGLFHLMAAVGIGRLTGFECVDAADPDDCDEAGTFGFPTFVEITFDPLPFLGVGVQGFANVNPDVTHGGIALMGRIGRLR